MSKNYDYMRKEVLETRKRIKNGKMKAFEEPITENFIEDLKKVLKDSLSNVAWEQYLRDINKEIDNEIAGDTKEKQCHEKTMESISKLLSEIKSYTNDLYADIYLAILRSYDKFDVRPNDLMKLGWDSQACNSRIIDTENARMHYPLLDYVDKKFPFSGILGGCEEYHSLMMLQENIGIFDIDAERKSLRQYAYPKSSALYEKLTYSPVENLLLLEKTLGIGYVNQLYHYMKKISDIDLLERLGYIYEKVTEIPMFLRKEITDAIWIYLDRFEYNDISIECMKKTVDPLTYSAKMVYKKLWTSFWQQYERDNLRWITSREVMQGTLSYLWRDYYYELEVKNDLQTDKKLHGWNDLKESMTNDDVNRLIIQDDERVMEIISKFNERRENLQYLEESDDDKRLIETLREIVDEKKKEENAIYKCIDPKRKTKKLTPIDVYAVVHEKVIQVLVG